MPPFLRSFQASSAAKSNSILTQKKLNSVERNSVESGSPYLTPSQIGELLQVKEFTVRLWLRRGLLKGKRLGKSWRVSRESLERFVKGA